MYPGSSALVRHPDCGRSRQLLKSPLAGRGCLGRERESAFAAIARKVQDLAVVLVACYLWQMNFSWVITIPRHASLSCSIPIEPCHPHKAREVNRVKSSARAGHHGLTTTPPG